jgi:4-amino-4-deoxy-L-arabinose transferase-like glycosyltransferase
MFFLASGLVLSTSLFLTAMFRLSSKPAYLISVYLCSYANIVLAGEITNSFHLLNRQWAFLALHAIFLVIVLLAWRKTGKSSLAGPFAGWRKEAGPGAARRLFIEWPDLALLGAGILAAVLFAAVLNFVVPPNNNDSLSTHLSRTGYWLQNGSFFPWPTSQALQLIYPVDSTLQFHWTILFWGSDRWAGFVQWIAALVSAVGVFGIARLLGAKRAPSALAALVFFSFPLVLLQITTTQNDLVITALFLATVYFLLLGIKTGRTVPLLLSAASLGLGLGTKQTCYFLLPGLALLLLAVWKQHGKKILRLLGRWLAAAAVSFLLFAAYMNVVNLVYWGGPFGPAESVARFSGDFDIANSAKSMVFNVPRYFYQMLDVSGLPRPLDGYANKVKSHIVEFLAAKTGFDIEGSQYLYPGHVFRLADMNMNQEDHAWFGLLSLLFFLPVSAWQFVRAVRGRDWIRLALLVNPIAFFAVFILVFPYWNPYAGRYFLPVVAVTVPLTFAFFRSDRLRNAVLRGLVAGMALVVIAVTMLTNSAKPVFGKQARSFDIWTSDRIALQTIQNHGSLEMFTMVEKYVPADATLGLYTPGYVLDYPLFGEHFTRRLVPIYPFGNLQDADWLQAQGIQYILVQELDAPPALPDGLTLLRHVDGWSLYTWETK